jgi:hypothetical protein
VLEHPLRVAERRVGGGDVLADVPRPPEVLRDRVEVRIGPAVVDGLVPSLLTRRRAERAGDRQRVVAGRGAGVVDRVALASAPWENRLCLNSI